MQDPRLSLEDTLRSFASDRVLLKDVSGRGGCDEDEDAPVQEERRWASWEADFRVLRIGLEDEETVVDLVAFLVCVVVAAASDVEDAGVVVVVVAELEIVP